MSGEVSHKHERVHCPRCNNPFVCNSINISACGCRSIKLSREETEYISGRFDDCVCNNCLAELKHEFYLKFHDNKTG